MRGGGRGSGGGGGVEPPKLHSLGTPLVDRISDLLAGSVKLLLSVRVEP